MSTPLARQNGQAGWMDNVVDLGFSFQTLYGTPGFMSNNQVTTSPDLQMEAGQTLFVLCQLVSGSLTIKVDEFVPGATHNFGSPAATLTLSAVTTAQWIALDVVVANGLGFGIQMTAGASGCQIGSLLIFSALQFVTGAGWEDLSSGQNATASAVDLNTLGSGYTGALGSGSGIVPRGPTASHLAPS